MFALKFSNLANDVSGVFGGVMSNQNISLVKQLLCAIAVQNNRITLCPTISSRAVLQQCEFMRTVLTRCDMIMGTHILEHGAYSIYVLIMQFAQLKLCIIVYSI